MSRAHSDRKLLILELPPLDAIHESVNSWYATIPDKHFQQVADTYLFKWGAGRPWQEKGAPPRGALRVGGLEFQVGVASLAASLAATGAQTPVVIINHRHR
jgi:hypothetical protein